MWFLSSSRRAIKTNVLNKNWDLLTKSVCIQRGFFLRNEEKILYCQFRRRLPNSPFCTAAPASRPLPDSQVLNSNWLIKARVGSWTVKMLYYSVWEWTEDKQVCLTLGWSSVVFALCLLIEKKIITYSDPMVTYSHPKGGKVATNFHVSSRLGFKLWGLSP